MIFLALAFLIFVAQGVQCGCGYWKPNAFEFPPLLNNESIVAIVFDPCRDEFALLRRGGPTYVSLWFGNGQEWRLAWEWTEGSLDHHFAWPVGMYFDPRLNALVMIVQAIWGSESQTGPQAYKYVEGEGWVFLAEGGGWCNEYSTPVLWDSRRQRAMLPTCYTSQHEAFLEFDGSEFSYIYWPEPHHFEYGWAAYDPNRGVVVFWGGMQSWNIEPFATYEYDGEHWVLIETHKHPTIDWVTNMIWDAELGEIIAVVCTIDDLHVERDLISLCETWAYRNQDWERIESQSIGTYTWRIVPFSKLDSGMTYLIADTWKEVEGGKRIGYDYVLSKHCRPSYRP